MRTHHEPVLDPTPLVRPVVCAHRRICHLLPNALYGRLTPDVDDRLDVPPVVYPTDKVPQGIVFPGRVFGLVGGKGGEEMGVRIDDRSGRCVGVGMRGEGEVRFGGDGVFFVLVFGHLAGLGSYEDEEGVTLGADTPPGPDQWLERKHEQGCDTNAVTSSNCISAQESSLHATFVLQ